MFKKLSPTDVSDVDNQFAKSGRLSGLGEITIVLRPSNIAMTQYIGMRVQLEDEGVIPVGTEWPKAFDSARWEGNGFKFQLKREKPEGAKGKLRDFVDCDNWCLRVTTAASYWPEDHVEIQKRKLAKMIYDQTPEGRAAFNRNFEAYWAAKSDEKYQAFKALIPGLVPPPRKRRQPSAEQSKPLA